MKYLSFFIVLHGFFFTFLSCSPNKGNNSSDVIIKNKDNTNKQDKPAQFQNKNVMGCFHWGINDDSFQKILFEWTKDLTINGFVTIEGFKVKNNGTIPNYDKDGHLEALKIEFLNFQVHPEFDYTDEEKEQIIRIYLEHNLKIKKMIDNFSNYYGNVVKNNFDEDSYELYLSSDKRTIAEWLNKGTLVKLIVQNTIIPGMTGCNMGMWVELNKIK